jgi:hypothetical protein
MAHAAIHHVRPRAALWPAGILAGFVGGRADLDIPLDFRNYPV